MNIPPDIQHLVDTGVIEYTQIPSAPEATLTVEQVAHVVHEAIRAVQLETGDPAPVPPWEQATGEQRISTLDSVCAALSGQTPEQLHESWAAAKRAAGWVHGEVKNAAAKTHPCLVGYHRLPAEQRTKDALVAAVVAALAPLVDRR
jgi:hypothetical protein